LQVIVDLGLDVPTLHLSPFIERNRRPYYDGLLAVSQEGDWAGWVSYILSAVKAQSRDVTERLRRLRELRRRYRTKALDAGSPPMMLRLIDLIFRLPAIDVAGVARHLGISIPPARKHVGRLVEAGVLKEVTQRSRDRIFLAHEIMQIVQDDG
jgi:Fic family protein